jgi:hypothetical protein
MTHGFRGFSRTTSAIACALLCLSACSISSGGGGGTGGTQSGQGGTNVTGSGGGTGGVAGTPGTGGQVGGATGKGGQDIGTGGKATGGHVAGATGSGGQVVGTGGGSGAAGAAGQTGAGGQAGRTSGDGGSQAGGATGVDGGAASNCVGKAWPTADPTVAGPFAIATDKNVGPLAGYTPDPIYGDTQQRFNVYRPKDLATSGYCHPILVWANGHGDNPAANKWCGTYPVLINQLASQGFVVVASLSTTTSKGDPLPTIVGLNWLLQQAEDSTSVYYHHLDTSHIGALGHSEGGMSTCKAAADPRIIAIGTVSGTSSITSLHGPALFICGGKDTVVSCDSVQTAYNSVKDQPAMFMNNLSADHGGWEYQNGAKGPDIFALTAWFRVHLMGDTANRKYFYGSSCTLCTDSRVTVQKNSLMTP